MIIHRFNYSTNKGIFNKLNGPNIINLRISSTFVDFDLMTAQWQQMTVTGWQVYLFFNSDRSFMSTLYSMGWIRGVAWRGHLLSRSRNRVVLDAITFIDWNQYSTYRTKNGNLFIPIMSALHFSPLFPQIK